MNGAHVAEDAGLYALGALTPNEREAFELHVRECRDCARAAGEAAADVATLASLEAQHSPPAGLDRRVAAIWQPRRAIRPRPSFAFAGALAAALILGLLPGVYFWSENRAMHEAMLSQAAAMDRLGSGTHRTASFTGPQPASVAYAPDGSWYVIMVHGASKTLHVAWMHDGQATMLGSASPHGDLAMLYLPKSHRMNRLALMDGERIVAQVSLSWGKTAPSLRGSRSASPAGAPQES